MSSHQGSQQYLASAVHSASPARLRLMLIERAIDVSAQLAAVWRNGESKGTNEHSLRLLDIINELLSGIKGGTTDSENALCNKIADLYVFLAKHLVAAESTCDAGAIEEIGVVLKAEAETWRAVCAQEVGDTLAPPIALSSTPLAGLNLEV